MKTYTFCITPNEYLRMLVMFITMVILAITGWRFHDWQYWVTGVILAIVFILIDKRWPRKK